MTCVGGLVLCSLAVARSGGLLRSALEGVRGARLIFQALETVRGNVGTPRLEKPRRAVDSLS